MIDDQDEDAEQPGRAPYQAREGTPQALLLVMQHAMSGPVHDTAVQHPGSHQHEGEQKEDEVVMVPRTNAAVGPDGVVVLLGHTGIAAEAVIGSHWLLYHTRGAQYPGVQTAGFSQHQHIHFLLLFSCSDEAGVRPAGAEVVVE